MPASLPWHTSRSRREPGSATSKCRPISCLDQVVRQRASLASRLEHTARELPLARSGCHVAAADVDLLAVNIGQKVRLCRQMPPVRPRHLVRPVQGLLPLQEVDELLDHVGPFRPACERPDGLLNVLRHDSEAGFCEVHQTPCRTPCPSAPLARRTPTPQRSCATRSAPRSCPPRATSG